MQRGADLNHPSRDDRDLTDHQDDALASMRIVEAADKSSRTGRSSDL